MSSWSNRQNRKEREAIGRDLDRAERYIAEGNSDAAARTLQSASDALGNRAPYSRFRPWRPWTGALCERLRQLEAKQCVPCDCWFCSFDPSQQQSVYEEAEIKRGHLDAVYGSFENNFTGAFAEIVFGVRFGWEVNLTPGVRWGCGLLDSVPHC
jgi:hypothetical protein